MKVCFVSVRLYPLSVSSGIGTVVTQVAKHLMRKGYEVSMITIALKSKNGIYQGNRLFIHY